MIGVFDSGVGGLSTLQETVAILPTEDFIYLADQAHVPYGKRDAMEIVSLCRGIVRFFIENQVKLTLVACNTATAAALDILRTDFPEMPFVGMEPAVKPGAAATRTGKVGILATAGTFESQRYASLMARYAQEISIWEDPCIGLVELIEADKIDHPETEQLLRKAVTPMLNAGIDTLILGCTHYPFIIPTLRRIVGDHIAIINPAPAVARQVKRMLTENNLQSDAHSGQSRAYTSGDDAKFAQQINSLLGIDLPVSSLQWHKGELVRYNPTLISPADNLFC